MSLDSALRKAPPFHLTLAHLVIGGAFVFVAGNLVFAMSLRLLPGAILGLGCLGAAFIILREASRNGFLSTPVHLPFFALCMATGFVLCLLAGQAHLFYAAEDWLIRDAVLADLSASALPAYSWDQEAWVLRAPLGMYLLPGAFGRLAGLGAAHAMMLLQNACLMGCALYLIADAFERRACAFLGIVVLFSGLDCIGWLLFHSPAGLLFHTEGWNPLFQYSSFVTQIFWVPNHARPGWWFAALLALHLRGGGLAPILLVFFAAALLWSPLAMMGALPFVLFVILREPRTMLTPQVLWACVAGAAFLPVAIYLQADAARVAHRWIVDLEIFPLYYALFIGLEIPHTVFVAAHAFAQRRSWSGALVWTIVMLLVIPFYWWGPANDFAMRASIVPLMILSACFATRALELNESKDPIRFVIWIIIVIGAATPLTEITRNIRMKAYAISPCDLISSWRERAASDEGNLDHYIVRADHMPGWLLAAPQDRRPRLRETESCWPDYPVPDIGGS